MFVVESSGFVTRSAKELLVAAVGGVFSLGEDIVQFASQISDQMVIREWNVQLCRSSREVGEGRRPRFEG